MALLEVRDVTLRFGGIVALDGVSLTGPALHLVALAVVYAVAARLGLGAAVAAGEGAGAGDFPEDEEGAVLELVVHEVRGGAFGGGIGGINHNEGL